MVDYVQMQLCVKRVENSPITVKALKYSPRIHVSQTQRNQTKLSAYKHHVSTSQMRGRCSSYGYQAPLVQTFIASIVANHRVGGEVDSLTLVGACLE